MIDVKKKMEDRQKRTLCEKPGGQEIDVYRELAAIFVQIVEDHRIDQDIRDEYRGKMEAIASQAAGLKMVNMVNEKMKGQVEDAKKTKCPLCGSVLLNYRVTPPGVDGANAWKITQYLCNMCGHEFKDYEEKGAGDK